MCFLLAVAGKWYRYACGSLRKLILIGYATSPVSVTYCSGYARREYSRHDRNEVNVKDKP